MEKLIWALTFIVAVTAVTTYVVNSQAEPKLYSYYDEEQQVVCYYTRVSIQCMPAVEGEYE